LDLNLVDIKQKLRAALLVVEQNLSWRLRTPNVAMAVAREAKEIRTLGVEERLRRDETNAD
jgi:hypothetical protein